MWAQLEGTAQKYSISKVAYEMKRGDVIYVRYEGKIICRGTVKGKYRFDHEHRIIDDNGEPWSHQVPVKWDTDFAEFHITDLGPVQYTVWELSPQQLQKVQRLAQAAISETRKQEAIEGDLLRKESYNRSRNRALIEAKKASSDYRCEVCGFGFREVYGPIGHQYIVAHHIDPLGGKKTPRRTTLDDIALLCANCHAMVHKGNPPPSLDRLRTLWNRYNIKKR